jgi:sugar O-acyltransferase (sialic acid O-acetyltransferase NeuD family)
VSDRVPLVVYGAGGHGKVVAEAALQSGRFDVLGFLDDDAVHHTWCGLPILGGRGALFTLERSVEIALGIGTNADRAQAGLGILAAERSLATVVHPTASIASRVSLGAGTYVGPLAVVHADASTGRGCIVNSGAIVEHDCVLGDWVHVSPRAALGGGVRLGEGVHAGLGALVLPGLHLGPWTRVGAGAVVTASLPPGVTAVGIPARVREIVEVEQ